MPVPMAWAVAARVSWRMVIFTSAWMAKPSFSISLLVAPKSSSRWAPPTKR